MKALSTRHPSVSATVSEVIYASKSPWTEAFEKTSVTAGANEIKCIKKKKHKHDTYLLDGTFMLCYPCLHSRMTMWVSHPVAKYLFLLMLVWHFKTFFIGKIKSWGDWHCERTHFQTLLFCTSDKLCRHPWDSSHLYHFASLSSWIFRTTHCRWSQKLGGIRTMNFRTQTSRLSYWGNVIHLLGSTKKVFKPYFLKKKNNRSLKYEI